MMIRGLWPTDIEQLMRIHHKYYKQEFDFPLFYKNFLCSFTVIDNEKIIASGGVRTITEAVVITNKDFPALKRVKALKEILGASNFICEKFGYNELHAFVQDPNWKKQLENYGFRDTKGDSLVINVKTPEKKNG